MLVRVRRRVHADVSPVGAAVWLALHVISGWGAWAAHTIAHALYEAQEISTPVSAPASMYAYVAAVTALGVGQVVCHELGHVAAGRARGLRWEKWGIRTGGTPNVTLGGRAKTHLDQLLVSLAGPTCEAAYGVALLALNVRLGLPGWSPLTVAAWLAIANATLGVLAPLRAGSDSRRIYRCGWAVLAGRGSQPHLGA